MMNKLPPELMMGGFSNSAESLDLALDAFSFYGDNSVRPRIFYPGSSSDASLALMDTIEVVHCDPMLTESEIMAFQSLGATAFAEDAEQWKPDGSFDAVVFINGSGIDERKVLSRVDLKAGGLALWAMWGDSRPFNLSDMEDLELVAVTATTDHDGGNFKTVLDTENPQDYIDIKEFEDLSTDELDSFRALHAKFLDPNRPSSPKSEHEKDAYHELALPQNDILMFIQGYAFPRKKENATFYIFQKQC